MNPDLRAVGWALKDLVYAAWGQDPPQALRAAAVLSALAQVDQQGHEQRHVRGHDSAELSALAAWTGGIAHVLEGRLTDAVAAFDAAAERFEEAGLPDPAAQTQVPRIMALSMLGRHDEAADCAGRALAALRAVGNWRAAGRVSQNLGGMHLRRDAYPDAARCYAEAAALFARSGDLEHAVIADIGLADAQAAMGDLDAALHHYTQARRQAEAGGFEMSAALVDESVALVDLARGRYREALAGLESARRRYQRLGLPQMLAIAEKQLGDAYLELRLLPEALALFDAAVRQFAALELPDEQAWALSQRGRALAWLGEADAHAAASAASAAAAAFAEAADLFGRQGNAVGAAVVVMAQAEIALAGGDAVTALALATRAAAGFELSQQAALALQAEVLVAQALLDSGQVDAAEARFAAVLQRPDAPALSPVRVRCLAGQGRIALSRGDRPAARAAFEAAIDLSETLRRALPGDDFQAAFLGGRLAPFEQRLRMAAEDGDAVDVLVQLERLRARTLGERLLETPDPERRRERLQWLSARAQRLQQEAGDGRWVSEQLRRTEHALLEDDRRLRLTAPAAGAAREDAFDPARLAAALAPGDRLIEYGVLGDELIACVVGGGSVRLVRPLAAWPVVQAAASAARFQIDSLRHGAQGVAHRMPQLVQRTRQRLAALHALLLAPLADALAGAERVLVVPCSGLAALPFAAMEDAQGVPFGQTCQLAMAPSARVALHGLQRRPGPLRRVVALGESSRLPHAAHEARQVAAAFADGTALTGDDATLAALQRAAPGADLLHLACHAQFRRDNPRFSALQLADAPLTVDLIEALDLGPALVVISACETGLAAGDEAVGLVRAFLVAGAARVLASLWAVDDAVTARFMGHFYAALRAGASACDALGQAQRAVAVTHPHPHFWGAFALHGGF